MNTITVRSTWSWLRDYWLSPRRVRFWLIVVAILYTLVGFLVLPWAATEYAISVVEEDLGRELRIETVRTNPFTLTVGVENVALDDFDGHELMTFERLFVDFSWSSLVKWTAVIPTTRLRGARVHDEWFESGETRVTRLLAEFQRRPLPRAGPERGIIRPIQTGTGAPIAVHDIEFLLDDFVLADDAVAPFRVSGRFDVGGEIAFDGNVQVMPALDLSGTLDVDGLALTLAEPFAQRFAAIRIDSGNLSGEGELRSGPGETLAYSGNFRVDALDLVERDGGEDVVSWRTLTIGEIDFRSGERSLELALIRLDQPAARVSIAEDRSTNLGALLIEQPAVPDEEIDSFNIAIRDARFDGGVLALTDRSLPLPSGIHVHEISGRLVQFSSGQEEPSGVQITGGIDAGGEFAFDGTAQLMPAFDLVGTLSVSDLALALAEPFAQRFADIRIDSGSLSAEGELRSGPSEALAYAGNVRVDALHLVERDGGEDVMGWDVMIIDTIDFRLTERVLELSIVEIDQPSARVFIAEDRSTNLGDLLVEPSDASEPVPEGEGESFDIVIDGTRFDGGVLGFTDRSLPLPFGTRVHELSGGISRLAPGQEAPSRVDLEGLVGDYGQAWISGEIDPWNPLSRTRADLVFKNLDVPELSPYVVQFAGRRIETGRMDLDLGYVLNDGQIDASNNIVLRDLKLGETFEHPDATDLPLGLAIALLKDSEGVISVDIPVQGDVNDPEFSFGPAIRQALVDLLQEIVTSPFSLLASIIGVDAETDPDELAKVAFAPGSSEVAPPQRERLDLLRTALEKRPGLALSLPGPYAPAADRSALQRHRARAAMVERLEQAGVEVANPSLTAAETSDTLEAMFADRYPQQALTEVRKRFTTGGDDEPSEFDATAYREYLATEVRAAETVTEEDLRALAQARADAVRSYILGEGEPAVEPDRVRWEAPVEVEANDIVVLEIGLDAN